MPFCFLHPHELFCGDRGNYHFSAQKLCFFFQKIHVVLQKGSSRQAPAQISVVYINKIIQDPTTSHLSSSSLPRYSTWAARRGRNSAFRCCSLRSFQRRSQSRTRFSFRIGPPPNRVYQMARCIPAGCLTAPSGTWSMRAQGTSAIVVHRSCNGEHQIRYMFQGLSREKEA